MLHFCNFRSVLKISSFHRHLSIMSKSNRISVGENKNPVLNLVQHNQISDVAKYLDFEVLPTPLKSASDKKDYKVIQLRNKLIACLISDKAPISLDEMVVSEAESDGSYSASGEETDESDDSQDEKTLKSELEQKMAAVGLCVGVGSFSDPKEVPGMAHFLEHMVFMGSEKFPSENDFDSFIKKGGGSDNASTDTEMTCYYFECLEKHLYESLDKFSQFFIAPLMKKEAMTREREAIESEFQIALPSDSSRKEQLLASLALSESPVNSFPWGNLMTLKNNISDEELYRGVHEFRKRHYSAHRMTLAIQARLPMETLESYVRDCLSAVPNNNLPPDDFSRFANKVFDTPEFTRIYYVKPVKNLTQIDLTWSLPSLVHKYRSKPHQYVSHLMGDEGKGSLLSYLKKRSWAMTTTIGNSESGSEHNSIYSSYTVTIVLTNEGLRNIYEVIESVFSYINMLKKLGPQQRVFNELQSIANTAFRFSTEEPSVETVESICESMQIYPPEDYIAGSELYFEYDPEAITMVLDHLCPRKVNIIISSNNFPEEITFNKQEKWFGTLYSDREIPSEWMKKWESIEPFPEFAIPPPNPFLTDDFSLLEKSENHPEYPQKILHTPLYELWYRSDQKFGLPIAYYYVYLISPLSTDSARSNTMLDMMMNLLVYCITEELYPAVTANLSYSIISYEKGLMIKVNGYNEKLPILIDMISRYLVSFNECLSQEIFDAVKDKLLKGYYNKALKPSSLAKHIRLNLIVNNYFTPISKYGELLTVTLEEIKDFSREYMKSLYVKFLIQGNVTKEVASNTVVRFTGTLNCVELPKDAYPKFKVAQVPVGERCCRLKGFNKDDANSIITNYYQVAPFTLKNSVIIELIMLIIEEPLFDILRTKEQLGYHVYCSLRDTFGILGYTVTVNAQATKHTTQHVDYRIEEFLKYTDHLLLKKQDDDLLQIKEDLIKTKLCADVHLKEEIDRNWTEIVNDDYIFDRVKKEIEIIKDVKLDEIRQWWKTHNRFGNQEKFRKISIQVVGYDTNEKLQSSEISLTSDKPTPSDFTIQMLGKGETYKKENRDEEYFIQNMEYFRNNLYLYPPSHIKH